MNYSIIIVAYADQGEGTDPEALGLAFHHQGPTLSNAYYQAATNLVDRDRSGSNHLLWPRRPALSSPSSSF